LFAEKPFPYTQKHNTIQTTHHTHITHAAVQRRPQAQIHTVCVPRLQKKLFLLPPVWIAFLNCFKRKKPAKSTFLHVQQRSYKECRFRLSPWILRNSSCFPPVWVALARKNPGKKHHLSSTTMTQRLMLSTSAWNSEKLYPASPVWVALARKNPGNKASSHLNNILRKNRTYALCLFPQIHLMSALEQIHRRKSSEFFGNSQVFLYSPPPGGIRMHERSSRKIPARDF
jgi:hypothetical protein